MPVLTEAAEPLLPRNHAASVAINTVTLASIRLGESPLSKQSTTPHPTNDAGFKNDGMQVVDVSNNDDDDKASSAAPPPASTTTQGWGNTKLANMHVDKWKCWACFGTTNPNDAIICLTCGGWVDKMWYDVFQGVGRAPECVEEYRNLDPSSQYKPTTLPRRVTATGLGLTQIQADPSTVYEQAVREIDAWK